MSQPTAYVKVTDFSQEESVNVGGRSTVRTDRIDAELDNVELTLGQVLAAIALIQRDDGKLRDGLVEIYNLSASARASIGLDINPRGIWGAGRSYAVNDMVEDGGASYVCAIAHTSTVFATDHAAEKWLILAGNGGVFLQGGTGALSRSSQDKMREVLSVADFSGADPTGAASSTSAFTSAATQAAGGTVQVPSGTWKLTTTPTLGSAIVEVMAGATLTGSGAAAIGYTNDAHHQTLHAGTSGSDFATRYIRRTADHTGGTPGFTASAFRVDSYVASGVANFEWSITGVMSNSATGGQNAAGYFLGRKMVSNAGATFGAVIDLDETVAINDPLTSSVGLEVDVRSNGTDANDSRIGLDIFCGRYDPAGVATQVGYGARIQNDGDTTGVTVKTGYGFQSGLQVSVGFSTANATVGQAAFKMAQGQNFSFNADATRLMSHTGGSFVFTNNTGTTYFAFDDVGSLQIRGTQILGSRRTGWGSPTGTASRATFDTTTVTLANLAATVRALVDDLTIHGLIGA